MPAGWSWMSCSMKHEVVTPTGMPIEGLGGGGSGVDRQLRSAPEAGSK